jgi:excisionase family DNA binding protein
MAWISRMEPMTDHDVTGMRQGISISFAHRGLARLKEEDVATGLSWITLRQGAERAQVSEATLRREAKAGHLRAVRVGGRRSWRLRPEWVDEWLEAGHHVGVGADRN